MLAITVCANQLTRASSPSTVRLNSFWALIWSSQLIGGIRRLAPMRAVLNARVTSASARSPAPELISPSRIAYQRPISSSRALNWATILRSLSRARNAGCRQRAKIISCASPHRMIRNFIAANMVSSCRRARRDLLVLTWYVRPYGARAQPQKRGNPRAIFGSCRRPRFAMGCIIGADQLCEQLHKPDPIGGGERRQDAGGDAWRLGND